MWNKKSGDAFGSDVSRLLHHSKVVTRVLSFITKAALLHVSYPGVILLQSENQCRSGVFKTQ